MRMQTFIFFSPALPPLCISSNLRTETELIFFTPVLQDKGGSWDGMIIMVDNGGVKSRYNRSLTTPDSVTDITFILCIIKSVNKQWKCIFSCYRYNRDSQSREGKVGMEGEGEENRKEKVGGERIRGRRTEGLCTLISFTYILFYFTSYSNKSCAS